MCFSHNAQSARNPFPSGNSCLEAVGLKDQKASSLGLQELINQAHIDMDLLLSYPKL
jgi:hypothetical protein